MQKVNVIIPVYNAEKNLLEAIESVINRSCDDWKIIAVNDGSTDSNPDILKNYENRYPSKNRVLHQPNFGLSAARNAAIATENGEYIDFLDADDLWLPEKTDEQVHLLNNNSDIGLVYSDIFELKKRKLKNEEIGN